MLFALVHFCALRPITIAHFTCVFPFLVDDTHIVGPTLDVLLDFLRLQEEFGALRLSVQPTKCIAWFPSGLNQFISLLPCFLTPEYSLCIIGALMGYLPFVESFV